MIRRFAAILVLTILFCAELARAQNATPRRPNIVYILCDDLGIGDVTAFNPNSQIPTPCMDRLASQGMKFTDAHSTSAVCSPSRYSILTGRYNWRSRLQSGVLDGYTRALISPGRLTVASLLKDNGYSTACFGKWHLGMNWSLNNGKITGPQKPANVDYASPIQNGPLQVGFEEYFGIVASADMAPFVFVHNDRVTEIPSVTKTFKRTGDAAPNFDAVDIVPQLVTHSIDFVQSHADGAKAGKPFFMYVPLTSPHTPVVPSKEWQGKSKLGPYGDFVMQTDDAIGQIVQSIDRAGLADNTLIIVTSDNGFAPYAGVRELENLGHYPSINFRGYKSDIWEGGHRIPMIARWPGVVKEGRVCDALVCQIDLIATCADIIGAKLPDDAAQDSFSILDLLRGGTTAPSEVIINHSIEGHFAIRQNNWKLIVSAGSGGWSSPTPAQAQKNKDLPPVQLYDLRADPGEKTNLYKDHPETVERLRALLNKSVADGRTRPGPTEKNDVAVKIEKPVPPKAPATQTSEEDK